jgi:hypothetical protein
MDHINVLRLTEAFPLEYNTEKLDLPEVKDEFWLRVNTETGAPLLGEPVVAGFRYKGRVYLLSAKHLIAEA